MTIYRNSDMRVAIEEYVHNDKYRALLLLRYCEGRTYEEIAEAVNFSPQHVKYVCRTYHALLMSQV